MLTQSLFDEFQKRDVPVRHVMFVVHGIGPSIGNGGYFLNHLENLKGSLAEVQNEKFEEYGAIEIFPIEWHNVLHEIVDNDLNNVSLPTCQFMRSVNNNILADVLFYCSKPYGQVIVETVAHALNNTYEKFMKDHPDYEGTFSLVGYSLGGVCCYDILAHQEMKANAGDYSQILFEVPRLKFQPSNFFALGSPIGFMMVLRNQRFESYQVPEGCTFNNIFHPYDPVGYRVEPLIEDRYKEISPHPLDTSQERTLFPFKMPSYEDFVFVNVTSRLTLPAFPSVSPPQMIDKMLSGINRQFNAVLELMSYVQQFRQNAIFLPKSFFKQGHRITFKDTKRVMQIQEDKELGVDVITLLPQSSAQDEPLEAESSNRTNMVAGDTGSPSLESSQGVAEVVESHLSVHMDMSEESGYPDAPEDGEEHVQDGGDGPLSESIYYCENGRELMSSFMITSSEDHAASTTAASWVPLNTAGQATQKFFGALKRMSSNLPGLASREAPEEENREEVCYQFSDQPETVLEADLMDSPVETMETIFNELYVETDGGLTVADTLSPMFEVTVDSSCGTVESSSTTEDPLPFKKHPHIKHRVDFVLQGNFMDYVSHQYVLGSRAHFSYWNNRDVAYHILKRIR
ncbi:hypothetical protein K493DRAFT_311253 [Basidiobolus meristosporus CBS 931.73]|uniref:DDHD domain-containing protein n=1 Tax=Basidiobolus meristosporus CBS 931.73 TaxID=1314790 RepID=A0A1Y1Z3D4_9FUNG|nr:hypothetical protein K493DRAFT_311253 [Basidiobolus meristosporus CBS 931.73]|eukprot:ORY04716.1 hypothetical protein K493DRAFT_311253 [Basidiobolus meristosporus CBS 931.73]